MEKKKKNKKTARTIKRVIFRENIYQFNKSPGAIHRKVFVFFFHFQNPAFKGLKDRLGYILILKMTHSYVVVVFIPYYEQIYRNFVEPYYNNN